MCDGACGSCSKPDDGLARDALIAERDAAVAELAEMRSRVAAQASSEAREALEASAAIDLNSEVEAALNVALEKAYGGGDDVSVWLCDHNATERTAVFRVNDVMYRQGYELGENEAALVGDRTEARIESTVVPV